MEEGAKLTYTQAEVAALIATHADVVTAIHGVGSGSIVGTTLTQTLTNKTLTSPTINGTIGTTGLTLPAFTLGGALTLNGQVFDAGSGSAEIDTTGAGLGLIVKSTNDGAVGAKLTLQQVSASPAAGDLCILDFIMRNDTGGDIIYVRIRGRIQNVEAGAENALLDFFTYKNGTLTQVAYFAGSDGRLYLSFGLYTAGFADAVSGYKTNAVQVVGARVIDARCDDTINSGDATTDGVIDALRDAMITHGLIAAA